MKISSENQIIGVERAKGADIVYISHAHADHLIKTKKPIIASNETIDLMNCNKKLDLKKLDKTMEGVEMYDAGHILGSTQLRHTEPGTGKIIVHTGDMKLRDGFTTTAAPILECDELHIDCTFGDYNYKFPSKEELSDEITNWVRSKKDESVVFGAYQTGKAQELIKILNNEFNDPVLVHPSIESRCKVYEKYGIRLNRICSDTDEAEEIKRRGGFIEILPFHKVNARVEEQYEQYSTNVNYALATGWSVQFRYTLKAFALSDHGDYEEIVRYARESKAKKIICNYGHAYNMARELKHLGMDAITKSEFENKEKKLIENKKLEDRQQQTLIAYK